MAERNERHSGLFLHAHDTARGDRIVNFLCPEGLLPLFIFGGPKSSLRSSAMPFTLAEIEAYRDARTEFVKLTGVNVLETFPGVQRSFAHVQSATGAAEFVLRTSAFGGDSSEALGMMIELLRQIDGLSESEAELALHIFLWKSLGPLGLAPDTASCERCGRAFIERGSMPGRLLRGEQSILCARCAEERRLQGFPPSAMIVFDDEARRCLSALAAQPYADATASLAASAARDNIVAIIESLTESAAEGPLQTLRLFH